MKEDIVTQIFNEIFQAIEDTKSNKPVTLEQSKFLIKLKEIKKKYEI